MRDDLKDWAEAQVAAGRAPSVEALAAARAEVGREGWIDGDDALAELRAWIAEDAASETAAQ